MTALFALIDSTQKRKSRIFGRKSFSKIHQFRTLAKNEKIKRLRLLPFESNAKGTS